MSALIPGILSVLAGASINNLGIVLQKRQVNLRMQLHETSQIGDIKGFARDPVWILGILMQTVFVLPFFILALDLIGVTLAQPLSNAGIIILVLGLVYFLKETLKRSEAIAVGVLVLGAISIGIGGVSGEITQASFLRPDVLGAFGVLITILFILAAVLVVLGFSVPKTRLVVLGLLAGLSYAGVALSMQVLTLSLENLSGHVSILMLTFGLIGTIAGTVCGIVATQEAFKRGRAVNIIPFVQITMNLIPIAAGLGVFGQTLLQPLFFWLGVVGIIGAATLLARFQE
jgi:drug/metabolite transporter (DMT)-like permease